MAIADTHNTDLARAEIRLMAVVREQLKGVADVR